jgi:hypothetical protein
VGRSKTYRGKPGWQGNNTNRGAETAYSKGNVANPEGTHMSGESDWGRKGAKSGAGKSKSSKAAPSKQSGLY